MDDTNSFWETFLKNRLIIYLKKHYKIYFLLIAIFILFKSLIETQTEYLLIDPILSKAHVSGLFIDLVFIFVVLWLVIDFLFKNTFFSHLMLNLKKRLQKAKWQRLRRRINFTHTDEKNSIGFFVHVIKKIVFTINKLEKLQRKYIYSENVLILSIIISITYLVYRLSDIWFFYPLTIIPFLKFLDLLLIYFLLNIIGYVFQKKEILNIDKNEGFVFDNPIKSSKDDVFNRKEVAKTIANKIINTVSDDSSFTIGIQSEWGYGKTSFLNLIIENVEKYKKGNIQIIKYNPWLSYEKNALTQNFFDVIIAELKSQNSHLSSNISLYSKALSNIEDNSIFSKALSSLLNISFPKQTINELFKKINNSIIDSKLQLIIVIDDIDRLNKEEIVEIIRLVRNVANFTNTTFIMAYDKSYVINALRMNDIFNPEKYLEKIFQYEHILSPINKNMIKKRILEDVLEICQKNADNLTRNNEIQEDIRILFDDSYKSIGFEGKHFFWDNLKNFRDISRYINQLDISYQHLYLEINLCDLLNLEILRTKYPIVCAHFFKSNSLEYLSTGLINNKHRLVLKESKIPSKDINLTEYDIKIQMLSNPSKFGINQEDIEDVLNILKSLFPNSSSSSLIHMKSNQKSINDIIRYTVYTNYVLPSNMLPEIVFINAVNSEIAQFYQSIDNWIESYDLLQIHSKFISIVEFVDKSHYQKIIKAIFHFARKTYGDTYKYDNNDLLKKMNFDNYSLSKIYDSKEELKSFVLSVFDEAESPYFFDIQLLYHAHYNSAKFIINDEKINELRLGYLKKYLNEGHDITKKTWYLYFWCNLKTGSYSDSANRENEERNPKAKELIINYIKDGHIDDFILASLERWTEGEQKKYAVFNSFMELFREFEDFEAFLNQFDSENSKYIEEYQNFLKKYKDIKEKYPKGSIEFDFEKIPIDARNDRDS